MKLSSNETNKLRSLSPEAQIVLLAQSALRELGHDPGPLDGLLGSRTRSAVASLLEPEQRKPTPADPATAAGLDSRTAKNLATLLPEVQETFRTFLLRAKALVAPLDVRIISGTRTQAEQQALYQKYLAGGPQAAPPGHSNHNFGLAVDLGIFDPTVAGARSYIDGHDSARSTKVYRQIARSVGEGLGVEWGGDWKRSDPPHFQIRPSWAKEMTEVAMLRELRGGRKYA